MTPNHPILFAPPAFGENSNFSLVEAKEIERIGKVNSRVCDVIEINV